MHITQHRSGLRKRERGYMLSQHALIGGTVVRERQRSRVRFRVVGGKLLRHIAARCDAAKLHEVCFACRRTQSLLLYAGSFPVLLVTQCQLNLTGYYM